MNRPAIALALLACCVLCAGCSSGPTEIWQPEQRVQVEELEPAAYSETRTAGKLTLQVRQKVRVTETPSEHLLLYYEETYSEFDWDSFGLVFFSILGGVVTIGLTVVLVIYGTQNATDEND
jgi:photosystem II stability/assembly factor-like uncharacterized protein